ncbi:SPARC-related modular calcium-binding protein 2 isoform X2 [Drosophila tropicalis]|uniref:SPARC-related modular calcium-binding protein 2 isoform X2 n=1 Tax=Drosophila tropicalis TaxID=46794 RepID=UPI0035ABE2C7
MWLRCLFSILFLGMVVMTEAGIKMADKDQHQQESTTTLSLTLSKCAAKLGECDEREGPVCGTDDQTYPTRCHLLRVQCSGHQVSLKYRGFCKACLEARQYSRRQLARNPQYFVPRCRRDGTFAAMQCLGETGCWCSDHLGRPIENTSTSSLRSKPKCRAYRRNTRRRSPTRLVNPVSSDSSEADAGAAAAHRACSKTDRVAFNVQLIEIFRSEYLRSATVRDQRSTDADVLDWKFIQLDANNNHMLDRHEVRELKKLVKRAVKPRRCGRAFGKYCDVDKDESLNSLEWSTCLSKDGNNRNVAVSILNGTTITIMTTPNPSPNRQNHYQLHSTTIMHPKHDHTNTNIIGGSSGSILHASHDDAAGSSLEHADTDMETEDNYDDGTGTGSNGEDDDDMTLPSFPHSRTSLNDILNSKTSAETTNNENEGETNCWTDQTVALEEQSHGGKSVLYVPECMPDGRYQREQCYHSTPYCWCVNEDTGKHIPGTSVKNQRPQCDVVNAVRPMKGCPEPRKTQFLKELKEFLNTQLLPRGNTGSDTTIWKSEDERIATLSFVFLDKNKNKSWERKEWKVFRELVASARNLGKCGKKMPRYCDVNGDKKISLSEWLDCLQSQKTESATTAKPAQSNETATVRLHGSNPLEQYLKD